MSRTQSLPVEGGTPVEARVNLDWTRDPPPPTLKPFQAFLRGVDWATTGFGPMSKWPRELRQMARVMTSETTPVILYWGQSNSILYNEAYAPLIGNKHPRMLGSPASEVFPEFWIHFENIIIEQRRTGEAAYAHAFMLLMLRHGYLEETYFNWSLVPIISDEGYHVGCYGAPVDKTRDIIGARRRECESLLGQQTNKATTIDDLWDGIVVALSSNDKDVPFALFYSVDSEIGAITSPSKPSYACRLQRTIGLSSTHPLAKQCIDVQSDKTGFAPAMLRSIFSRTKQLLESSDPQLENLLGEIDWKGFGLPSRQFVVSPVFAHEIIVAFVVVGLNPHRQYNPFYTDFLDTIVKTIAPQVYRIRLSDEVDRRAELARRATLAFEQSEGRFSQFAARTIVGLATIDKEGKVSATAYVSCLPVLNSCGFRSYTQTMHCVILRAWIPLTLSGSTTLSFLRILIFSMSGYI